MIFLVTFIMCALTGHISYRMGYHRGVIDLRDEIARRHGGTDVHIRDPSTFS